MPEHEGTNWSQIGNFVVKVGVPSTIALYLVYIMTNGLHSEVRHVRDSLSSHTVQASEMIRQYEQIRIQLDKQLYVMQRICMNSARTTQAANECIGR